MARAVTGYPVSALLFPVSGKFSVNPSFLPFPTPGNAQDLQAHPGRIHQIATTNNREGNRKNSFS